MLNASGDLKIGRDTVITQNLLTFAPFSPVGPLITAGGWVFYLQSEAIDLQSSQYLNVCGKGYLTKAGYEKTAAEFTFSTTNAFSFTETIRATPTSVPERSTIVLVGAGLIGLTTFIRRRQKA